MKKIVSLFLVLLLMFSAVFCTPVSAASKTDGILYYELSENKKYYKLVDTVTDIKGSVKIPKKFKGLPIRVIDDDAFMNCRGITSVSIYSNIKRIEDCAFEGCENLSKIYISDYVEFIGMNAFDNTAYYNDLDNWFGGGLYIGNHFIAGDLNNISGNYRVKAGTKSIAESAFSWCEGLKTVILPDSITAIYDDTFTGCTNLKHIYIPEGVESIGDYAFSNTALKYIYLPSTLKEIGEYAFPSMNAIYIPSNVADLDSELVDGEIARVYGEKGSVVESFTEDAGMRFIPIAKHTHNIKTVVHSGASVKTSGVTYTRCDGCGQIFDYNLTNRKKPSKVKLREIRCFDDSINLYWNIVEGADGYNVYRKGEGEDSWTLVKSTSNIVFYDQNVKRNKVYKYTVRAFNDGGLGASSKTSLTAKYFTPPIMTGISNVTSGIKITWKKSKDADKYAVYRINGMHNEFKCIKTITDTDVESYIYKGAKSGERYSYIVVGYNDSYVSSVGYTYGITRLSRPKLSFVKSTKSGVKFTWEKVTGAQSYIVYRKTGSSGEWKAIKTIDDGSTVYCLDKTAKKGKTYYYSVRAAAYGDKSTYNTTGLKIKDKY